MNKKLQILNVGELIEVLGEFPKTYHVIISSDSEGNQFSPIYSIEAGTYEPNEIYNYDNENEIIDDSNLNSVFIYPTH